MKASLFLVNIKIEVMCQHVTLQHLLGSWTPETNSDPFTWCFGSLSHAEDEQRGPEWDLQ